MGCDTAANAQQVQRVIANNQLTTEIAMTTITIKGFISASQEPWERKPSFGFNACKLDAHGYITVMPYEFEVQIPDDFDITLGMVASLNQQKESLRREFDARVMEINDQISKLQALPYEAPVTA